MDDIISIPATNSTEINADEILRELGIENVQDGGTVIQSGNSTIAIPASNSTVNTRNSSELQPPPVEYEEEHNEDSNVAPEIRDLDAEEDEGLEELLNNGIINEVSVVETPNDTNSSISESSLDELVDEVLNNTSDNTTNVNNEASPSENQSNSSMLTTEEALKYLIPVNTKAVNIDDTTSRFSGAAWFKAVQESTIVLAGIGGIGSYVTFILSRMKPKQIFIYDDDIVERVNLAGQLYSTLMVGRKKVDACATLVNDFSEYNGIMAIPTKFTENTAAGDIMICGFDNMDARKTFFNVWLNHVVKHKNPENCLFIDGRLDIEEFQVFCMKGTDSLNIKRYSNEYLFNDWQAESVACSVKQTTYCANMIGSIIVNLYTNFIANTLQPVIERDLPFKTYYNASMMYLKTEF